MITRRELLIAFGAGVLAVPFGAFAQQLGKVWRIGYLSSDPTPASLESGSTGQFVQGMRDLGYVVGKNLAIEWRFADGGYGRLPDFAAELVKLRVDVIVGHVSPAIRAAQKATTTIPIVMTTTGDPVGAGFVRSLARPGGNITGLSNAGGEISAKQLEFLIAVAPKSKKVAFIGNPESTTYATHLKNVEAAAHKTKVRIVEMEARTAQNIEQHFASMRQERVDAVIVIADAFLASQKELIAELAKKYHLPTIHGTPGSPQVGGLMSYTQDFSDNYRRAATYVDKIFKGAKPADLPVEEPTRYELIINLKTAKALGLTIPPSILVRATKVIE